MQNNSSGSIVVIHNGLRFGFGRDFNGSGYWYCLYRQRSDYGHGFGYIVPMQYWSEIHSSAVSQGVDASLLTYNPPVKQSKSVSSSKIFSDEKPVRRAKSSKIDNSIKIF